MPLNHEFVSAFSDGGDATKLRPSNWNDDHVFTGGTAGQVLTRDTGAADGMIWVAPSGLSGVVPATRTVNGYALSSNIALVKADVGLSNVDNTTDAGKPVSTAGQTALNLKAPLASPTFTGTVIVPAASFANAALANMATKTYKGRTSSGTGVPEDVAVATLKADLGLTLVENTALSTYTVPSAMVSFLQSGTGAVIRTGESKYREIFSAKDFGAVGDGVADDWAAIQAALSRYGASTALSGALTFPEGQYRITNTLVYEGTNSEGLHLLGAVGGSRGPKGSRLLWDGHPGAGMFYFLGGNGLTIENLEIQAITPMKWGIFLDATNEYASTLTVNTTSLVRTSDIVTVTTASAHNLTAGMTIRIAGATNTAFNGTFITLTAPTTTTATYIQKGANDSTSGGTTSKHKSAPSSGSVLRRLTVTRPKGQTLTVSAISRDGASTGTATTAAAHYLVPGDTVHFAGVTDATFDGYFTVIGITSATVFTYTTTAGSASSSGGTVITDSSGLLFGHAASATEQVSEIAVYDTVLAGYGDGTSLHGYNWNQAGNVKNAHIYSGSANGFDYNVDWSSASGVLSVFGMILASAGVADFVTGAGSLYLAGVESETEQGARFVVGTTGSNMGTLSCTSCSWQATADIDDIVIDYQGSITLIGNTLHNNRVPGTSVAKIRMTNPLVDSTAANTLMSIGNWYENATGYIPITDGSNVLLAGGYYANKAVSVTSFGDVGGQAGALVKLNNVVPLTALISQKSGATWVPASGLIRMASADVAMIANDAGNADLNLLSKDTSDVVQVGDTAGMKSARATLTKDAIAVTTTDGVVIQNTTAATAGVPVQMSPRLRLRSHVWNTTTPANNTDDWFIESLPASAATPTGLAKFGHSANGAAATFPVVISSAGWVSVSGSGYGKSGLSPASGGLLFSGSTSCIVAAGSGSTSLVQIQGNDGAAPTFSFISRLRLYPPADAQINLINWANNAGVGLNVATDAVLKVRTRAQTGYGTVDALGYRINGGAGAVGSVDNVQKSVATIADATLTTVWTITVPNAAHSAKIRVTLVASLGAGGAIGANEASATNTYDIVVTRTAGVNAVAAISTAYGAGASAVAGAATVTAVLTVAAVVGAVGASNTFDVQITITKSGGASANHTCQTIAEVLNANATGITIA